MRLFANAVSFDRASSPGQAAASRAPIQPKHQGLAMRVRVRLCKGVEENSSRRFVDCYVPAYPSKALFRGCEGVVRLESDQVCSYIASHTPSHTP